MEKNELSETLEIQKTEVDGCPLQNLKAKYLVKRGSTQASKSTAMKSANVYISENWDNLIENFEEERSLRVSDSDDSISADD